jgi:hypothetical protein
MSEARRLNPTGPGTVAVRVVSLLTLSATALGVLFIANGKAGSLGVAACAAVMLVVTILVVRVWRVGVYETDVGLLIRGVLRTRVIAWQRISGVGVQEITLGFAPKRTVVVSIRSARPERLRFLNEHSALMLGIPHAVDKLSEAVDQAARRHPAL